MHKFFHFFVVISLYFLPLFTFAATLSLEPVTTSVYEGEIVTETIRVSSTDQAINAISATLSFSPDMLQITSLSKSGSVLSLWVQDPSYSNSSGSVKLSGISPNPGYIGSNGKVITVNFKAIKTGSASISFGSASVLANDGNGTNVLTSTSPSEITINQSPGSVTPLVSEKKTTNTSVPQNNQPFISIEKPNDITTTDHLVLSGTTYSSAHIILFLTSSDSAVVLQDTYADKNGHFQTSWKENLKAGEYTLTGETIDNKNKGELKSQPVSFTVKNSSSLQNKSNISPTLITIIIVLLSLVLFGIWYLSRKRKTVTRHRRRVHKP